MRPGTRLVMLAVSAILAGAAVIGCAESYYYIDSESYVRPSLDTGKYETAAILYFGYTEATTVVAPDTADVTDVATRSTGLKEQDVILFSNALIDELSRAGITLVERNRVADLVREQGLIENEFVDLSDLEKVQRLGKLLKADLLIKGSVFNLAGGYRITRGEDVYHVILVGLAVRAIDSRTGQIVWSDVTMVATRHAPEFLEDDRLKVSDYTVVRDMVGKMVRRFTGALPRVPKHVAAQGAPLAAGGGLETDSDGDGIEDLHDNCKIKAEDKDGFEDEDGCPDLDNDGDGIEDGRDKCPNEAGTKEGCPDPDRDGDGIPDSRDGCKIKAEDKDGFEDEDGCPDPDNDGDWLPDAEDKCPGEAETLNGATDEDGCPDEGAALVVLRGDEIELRQEILFRDRPGQDVREKSYKALETVASLLQRAPSIRLRVEVRVEPRGKPERQLDLSKRRAEAVKAFLVKQGVDGGRLEAIGYGGEKPPAGLPGSGGEAARRVLLRTVGN